MIDDAWALARRAADRAGVRVRALDRREDPEVVRGLIGVVWGGQEPPVELLRAMQHAGAVLYGAETNETVVGFVWGFVGLAGGTHLHSHQLGVVPSWEGRGVGYALKLAQRAASLEAGIDEVRWTFDPLILPNARLNLVRLGAEAVRYLPDFYGSMGDRLNRGDRSDRFEVRWSLRSMRTRSALAGTAEPPAVAATVVEADPTGPWAAPRVTGVEASAGCAVAVPQDYRSIRGHDPELARRWREVTGSWFGRCFAMGLRATWITDDGRYVFASPPR